jgi:rhamnosyltransferase
VKAPFVSIVILTRNGIETLPAVLDSIRGQKIDCPFEIVAVDSASTDGTAELMRVRADRFVAIRPDEFDHGLTRNLGIEQSQGDLIVLLVQDAVPVSDRWLEALIAPLREARPSASTIAGSFARQVPRRDASAITHHYHSRWVTAQEVEKTLALDGVDLDHLAPADRFLRCVFDNVCSCIRRSVWQRHPFRSTPIAEDLEWAREVLLAGYRIAYTPQAAVVHSHDRPARYELARTYVLHRRLYELFQLRTIPTFRALVTAVASSCTLHLECARAKRSDGRPPELVRALSLAFAWPVGQYLGSLSAVRGWRLIRMRGV